MSRHVPSVTASPLRLALRLLFHERREARSALAMAAAGVALTPLDRLLASREQALYREAPAPTLPLIFVCGPPRSGTTLVAHYLINTLDVDYLDNLSALFPRAPLLARALRGRAPPRPPGGYDAFYGRTARLAGINDALPIWDRWLGPDRDRVPEALRPDAAESMPRFFGALQARSKRPVVNKVNRLFTCAGLVSAVLPRATFLCLRREPLPLAQSLLIARREIGGTLAEPYGVRHAHRDEGDPIEDVCRQVEFYDEQMRRQRRLDPERFLIVDYEAFCRSPAALIERLRTERGLALARRPEATPPASFEVSAGRRLPADVHEALARRLAAGAGGGDGAPPR